MKEHGASGEELQTPARVDAERPAAFAPERLSAIRSAFPVLEKVCYLNTGTYGPMPAPALRVLLHATECLERDGVASDYPFASQEDAVRKGLASLIGAQPQEIALTRNATDGVNLVLSGLEWRAGDEVITTDQEHEAVWHPLLYMQARAGVRVLRVSPAADPDEMLGHLAAHVSSRTRLLAFSHVSCETGIRLPARQMCGWAREHGVLSLVDAAQSLGAVPVHVSDLQCDYLTGNGHKWLHGPKGTGFLYARQALMTALTPRHVGAGSLEHADFASSQAVPWDSGRRFEYGTRAYALMAGWRASLDWLGGLSYSAVGGHVLSMAGTMRAELERLQPVRVLTPREPVARSGLVSFYVSGFDAGALQARLWEDDRIVTRHVPQQNALRVSAAHFTSVEDVERLCRSIHKATVQ